MGQDEVRWYNRAVLNCRISCARSLAAVHLVLHPTKDNVVRLRRRRILIAVIVVLAMTAGGYGWYRYNFPYGRVHCCDKQLYFALREYAENHGGAFPAGEDTPEASLSLIHKNRELGYAYLLCGKSGSQSKTQAVLDSGELLGPETCGWHYVAGLRMDDDRGLALFWDKEGLGHFGQRLEAGGHIVMFVDGWTRYIQASDWDAFVAEQKKLFAKRKNAKGENKRNGKDSVSGP